MIAKIVQDYRENVRPDEANVTIRNVKKTKSGSALMAFKSRISEDHALNLNNKTFTAGSESGVDRHVQACGFWQLDTSGRVAGMMRGWHVSEELTSSC